MAVWLNGQGKISRYGDFIQVFLGGDFDSYYRWFIQREINLGFRFREGRDHGSADPFGNLTEDVLLVAAPMKPAHITVAIKHRHPHIRWNEVQKSLGMVVDFQYSVDVRVGGGSSNFNNFYLPVRSDDLTQFQKKIGVVPTYKDRLHITVANTKGLKVLKPPLPKTFFLT